MGPDQIALNQLWRITITVDNERLRNYSSFPTIDGLINRGVSSSSSTSYINGRMSSSQSIIQNYQATREGNIVIPDFSMTINDQKYTVKGKTLRVTAALQQQRSADPADPFQDFFNKRQESTEFIDVQADAFLSVSSDKTSVYVGEGFVLTVAFYVAESNKADMRFVDLGAQLTDILKKIKPTNCWEENFSIDNISGEPIQLGDKRYTQYKIYQAAYYPLNTDPIVIPSVGLKLIKYKQAKNPTFFGRNRQEDFETFNSKARKIEIKELPPHPMRDRVAVGNYRMKESISSQDLITGQSFGYQFNIIGEGNISAVVAPVIPGNANFDFYSPNTKQNITRAANSVRGSKTFDYYAIPNEPGEYDLSKYIKWIYFNPMKAKYDTLSSEIKVRVTGESKKNDFISSNDLGSFYDIIPFENNELKTLNPSEWLKIMINLFIFATVAVTAFVVIRKVNG